MGFGPPPGPPSHLMDPSMLTSPLVLEINIQKNFSRSFLLNCNVHLSSPRKIVAIYQLTKHELYNALREKTGQIQLLKNNLFFQGKLTICSSDNIFEAKIDSDLTLIGMRGDTFISLSFWDQILSSEFLSKISKKKIGGKN